MTFDFSFCFFLFLCHLTGTALRFFSSSVSKLKNSRKCILRFSNQSKMGIKLKCNYLLFLKYKNTKKKSVVGLVPRFGKLFTSVSGTSIFGLSNLFVSKKCIIIIYYSLAGGAGDFSQTSGTPIKPMFSRSFRLRSL